MPIATGGFSNLPLTPTSIVSVQRPQQQHGDAPTPPGMMDIEMEEPTQIAIPTAFLQMPQSSSPRTPGFGPNVPSGPWSTVFHTPGSDTPPQGVPPSLLSFSSSQTGATPSNGQPTPEQSQERAFKKAKRKAERIASKEDVSASDVEGEKRFQCPVEGCGKVYKQANGLKYHLTRSINSGHGNMTATGGFAALSSERGGGGG